jgi:hypothetical protein
MRGIVARQEVTVQNRVDETTLSLFSTPPGFRVSADPVLALCDESEA